jgi:predicted transcriptional regulator of viral defense system
VDWHRRDEHIIILHIITEKMRIDHMAIQSALKAPRTAQAADWALSRGIASMTTAQVAHMLNAPVSQVSQRLSAAKRRGEWITPARGLWAPVPPEFREWGGPPATEFIASLMKHLGVDYYVGWLAAAALYGATHHAPQVTHVAVLKLVRERKIGRARLVFHERSAVADLPTVERMARSGAYLVSSPEVTALDIASDITLAGGLDNATTVIADLAEEKGLDDQTLASLAPRFADAAARRVGWMVERFAEHRLDALAEHVAQSSSAPSRLHPSLPLTGTVDARWGLRLNATVEVE